MDKNLEVTATIEVTAPVATVWHGLTAPEMIKKYFFDTDVTCDWKKGSPIVFKGVWEGKTYEEKGVVLEVEENSMVQYSYLTAGLEDVPENYAVITYRLEASEGGTQVTVTQKGFRNKEAQEHSEEGWHTILEGLKSTVEL